MLLLLPLLLLLLLLPLLLLLLLLCSIAFYSIFVTKLPLGWNSLFYINQATMLLLLCSVPFYSIFVTNLPLLLFYTSLFYINHPTMLLLLLVSTTHFHAAIAAAAAAVIALWLLFSVQTSGIRCYSVSCLCVTHALDKRKHGVLSRESWKGLRYMLCSRQPMQRRLQHVSRLCGEADRPDAAQPHCELCCNSSGSSTGQLLQSRSVM